MMLTALRNRPLGERRVLMMLRGGLLPIAIRSRRIKDEPEPTPAQLRRFADLRRAALDYGLAIQPLDRPYVGADEMCLLAWLAEAQRVSCRRTAPDAPDLRAGIIACAAMLDGMELRLAPLTLYGARLRMLTG